MRIWKRVCPRAGKTCCRREEADRRLSISLARTVWGAGANRGHWGSRRQRGNCRHSSTHSSAGGGHMLATAAAGARRRSEAHTAHAHTRSTWASESPACRLEPTDVSILTVPYTPEVSLPPPAKTPTDGCNCEPSLLVALQQNTAGEQHTRVDWLA